jgi:hypothetical protein
MALGSTQPLTQMSTRNLAGGKGRPARKADNLTVARVWSCGICGTQSAAGVGFLQVLRFPLPIFIPPVVPQSPSSIIWGWYNRSVVAAVTSGQGYLRAQGAVIDGYGAMVE